MVKRAAKTAARSLLADYGSQLKEQYGIFALQVQDEAELCDRFEEYLACNLSIPFDGDDFKGKMDLFGFRVESVSVTPAYNLSENRVTKQQILEYMKYRAPAGLVEGFVDRLSSVREIGKMSEAYKKKVGIDKILGRLDKSQQRLKKNIDGSGKPGEKFINGFNMGGCWESAFQQFNALVSGLSAAQSSLETVNGQINDLESDAAGSTGSDTNRGGTADTHGDAADGDGNDSAGRLDNLKTERDTLRQSCSEIYGQLQQLWSELRYSMTNDYITANDAAIQDILSIVEKGRSAQASIAELEEYLTANFGTEGGTFSGGFEEQTRTELEGLKQLILDGQRAEEIMGNVGKNSDLLKRLAAKLDATGMNSGASGTSVAGLPQELLDMVKRYSAITYNYSKPDRGGNTADPRPGKAEAVKDFIAEKIWKDVNFIEEGVDEQLLPSRTKKTTGSFEEEDADYLGGRPDTDRSGETPAAAAYGGNLQNVGEEVDLYDEEGMFQENALGFISGIGNLVSGGAAALRDNIYLNEYIMGTFKNAVPVEKQGDVTKKDTNLHGTEKDGLPTYYDCEVEYVLHGNASQSLNNIMTKGELLLVRFGLNTLHVYADGKKKTVAASIATAVAGWWTGGAGIPVLSNLIMCGWGMGEAMIDLSELMAGKSVPIYKLQGDWKLDVGLPASSGPKTDARLYFNYHDYLRLFLLAMDENKKLDRVEDLIQLNMDKTGNGFTMTGCNTFVRVEAAVSMKYLFITRLFTRDTVKTKDGRHKFRVLVYEGY